VFLIHIPLLTAPIGEELSSIEKHINFWLQQYVCRLAVPFYFVCSGFFLFKKMSGTNVDIARVKNYCFKLFMLLGIWNVLLFIGETGHLWFLGATIVAVALLSILLYYHVKLKWLIVIACGLYTLGLLGDSYFGLIKPFVTQGVAQHIYGIYAFFIQKSRNGFFMGFIFVLMGYVFAQGKIKPKKTTALIGFAVSMICFFVEAFVLKYNDIPEDYNMYISLLPAVFFLFAFVFSLSLKNRPIYVKLRTVSVLVYFLHILINSIVTWGIGLLYGVFEIDIQTMQFFISLPITLATAFGIEWLSRKEKFKWITWFLG
jgi:serine/alanine racemase